MPARCDAMTRKKRLRNDLILIAALLLIALAGLLAFRLSRRPGEWAVVLIDGVETARYPLSEDLETVVSGAEGSNTLVIRDGAASIAEADCPDGICVAHRPIAEAGETIVCLPHKLVVKIQAPGSAGAVDGGTQVGGNG